jgi:hypothetical protein
MRHKSTPLSGPVTILVLALLLVVAGHQKWVQLQNRGRALMAKTRSDERLLAAALQENAFKLGGVTNISQDFVAEAIHIANAQYGFALRTNQAGEPMDLWETPYRIELAGPTNFIIRSAGRTRKFGAVDESVFNSASNAFVKP